MERFFSERIWTKFGHDLLLFSYQWTSLRSLSNNALDMKLSKNYHIRCGDWEASVLSQAQILYAAKDAIVSLEVFYALILLRKLHRQDSSILSESFNTKVELITEWVKKRYYDGGLFDAYCYYHSTDQLCELASRLPSSHLLTKPSPWLKELAYSLCQGIVDVNHKSRPPANVKSSKSNARSATSSRGMSTKASQQKTYKHQCRDKPLYENCFLLSPDKKVLATVNHSKAQWYIHKGLGEYHVRDHAKILSKFVQKKIVPYDDFEQVILVFMERFFSERIWTKFGYGS